MNKIKLFMIAVIEVPLFMIAAMNTTGVRAVSNSDDETVKTYKTKCMMCHGPTAAKFYEPEMAMEEQVEAILKGKKAAKPPHMPGFEDKGIDAEKALALAEHMKALRTAATD